MPSGWGSNCWLTKTDGVSVMHDKFWGMGLSGVQEFMGAVLVDVGGRG